MKKAHKAIKLSLVGLATLIALIGAQPLKAEQMVIELEITHTPENIKISEEKKSPEEKALDVFKGFFTDPNYKVEKSFQAMCCEAIPFLEQSEDADLRALAKILKEVCTKTNLTVIGSKLLSYAGLIQRYFGNILSVQELKERLKKALKL